MNFSKVMAGLVFLGASAATPSVFVGAGVSSMYFKPSFKTAGDLLDPELYYVPVNNGVQDTVDGNKIYKTTDKAEGFFPSGAFGTINVTFDGLVGSLSVGFGADFGFRYNVSLPNEGWYGAGSESTVEDASGNPQFFGVKYPTWNMYGVVKFLIGADLGFSHLLLSIGLDISRPQYSVNLGNREAVPGGAENETQYVQASATDVAVWQFGVKGGFELLFDIADCAAVGLGAHYTYWPESWNKMTNENVANEFNASITEKNATVLDFGGSYAVGASLTANFAFN